MAKTLWICGQGSGPWLEVLVDMLGQPADLVIRQLLGLHGAQEHRYGSAPTSELLHVRRQCRTVSGGREAAEPAALAASFGQAQRIRKLLESLRIPGRRQLAPLDVAEVGWLPSARGRGGG